MAEPPLRQHVVAKALGCSTRYLRKLMDADVIRYETLPCGTERRIPAEEVARLTGQSAEK